MISSEKLYWFLERVFITMTIISINNWLDFQKMGSLIIQTVNIIEMLDKKSNKIFTLHQSRKLKWWINYI